MWVFIAYLPPDGISVPRARTRKVRPLSSHLSAAKNPRIFQGSAATRVPFSSPTQTPSFRPQRRNPLLSPYRRRTHTAPLPSSVLPKTRIPTKKSGRAHLQEAHKKQTAPK